jgi:uncharacterized protein YbjT (DUF2867 family)
MSATIFVTGASGNVGSELIRLLQRDKHSLRIADRQSSVQQASDGIVAVPFDFGTPASFKAALAGVERLFLMRPPAISNVRRYIFPVIDAAREAGVKHIVFLSLIGVEKNRIVPHYKIEQHIIASGLDYTFLRAGFFMQNLNTTHRREIKERDEIFIPAGIGKTSFIDVRDIAAVAACALTQAGHANQTYELTGAEALDYHQVAALCSGILSRTITYRNPSLRQFVRRQRALNTPWPFVLVMAGIYTTVRLGLAARITADTWHVLGRAPVSFNEYVVDYQAAWE